LWNGVGERLRIGPTTIAVLRLGDKCSGNVGGTTAQCTRVAKTFYSIFLDHVVTVSSTPFLENKIDTMSPADEIANRRALKQLREKYKAARKR